MTEAKAKQLQTAIREFSVAEDALDAADSRTLVSAAEDFVRAGHVLAKLVGRPAPPAVAPFVGEEPR